MVRPDGQSGVWENTSDSRKNVEQSSMDGFFSYIFLVFSILIHVIISQDVNIESIFPDDVLTPYRDHYRTRRSLRFVRECQPVYFGNRTHEEFPASNAIKSGQHFAKIHNLFYEYSLGDVKQQVHGHYGIVEDPLRTFSIVEPGGNGGCNQSRRATVSQTARQRNCIIAANAGYFRTKNGNCLGNIYSDGRKVLDAQGFQNVNFGIRKDGTIFTGYLSEEMMLDEDNPFVQLVSGVVWLLRNGQLFINESKKIECQDLEETGTVDMFVNVVSGRTAIGHDAQGNVVLVQVDGRTSHRGMNLYEFAKYLKKLGLVNAINLDGGGSATFVVNGTTVNYPSDQCGEFICARKVSTIACFHEPDCNPRDCNKHGSCQMGVCECGQHWTGDQCDVLECSASQCSLNGICTEGGCVCSPGWTGRECEQACPSGTFGVNCSSHCTCINDGRCDGVTGDCLCAPGWIGDHCQLMCPPGKFGIACKKECNCSMPCECDAATGFCNNTMNRKTKETNYWKNSSQNWMTCLASASSASPTAGLSGKEMEIKNEYRKLLFWFVGVTSLCAVSMLANFILMYLQCNSKRKRRLLEEQEFLFISDEEL